MYIYVIFYNKKNVIIDLSILCCKYIDIHMMSKEYRVVKHGWLPFMFTQGSGSVFFKIYLIQIPVKSLNLFTLHSLTQIIKTKR